MFIADPGLFSLSASPSSNNFPPQCHLLVQASCWPHSRHQAEGKVEGHPVCHFPGTIQHFLVFVGCNLVPGAHLDEVSLRNGSLFWEVIKKGRIDVWW